MPGEGGEGLLPTHWKITYIFIYFFLRIFRVVVLEWSGGRARLLATLLRPMAACHP